MKMCILMVVRCTSTQAHKEHSHSPRVALARCSGALIAAIQCGRAMPQPVRLSEVGTGTPSDPNSSTQKTKSGYARALRTLPPARSGQLMACVMFYGTEQLQGRLALVPRPCARLHHISGTSFFSHVLDDRKVCQATRLIIRRILVSSSCLDAAKLVT